MAANEPIPINAYSRTETDLKLENVEQRLNGRFDQMMSELRLMRSDMNAGMASLRADMDSGMASIRAEAKQTKTELEGKINEVKHELQTEMTVVKGQLTVVTNELGHIRWMYGGLAITLLGIALTALGRYLHWI